MHGAEYQPELGSVPEYDKPQEACGVVGVLSANSDAVQSAYVALSVMQHRGQEAAGIAMADEHITIHKDTGLVSNVFNGGRSLQGFESYDISSGHVRYGTSEGDAFSAAQPILFESDEENVVFTLSQNGHISNYESLAEEYGLDHEQITDSMVLTRALGAETESTGDIRQALNKLLPKVEGAFSLVIMEKDKLIAVRDHHGIRPLVLGNLPDGGWMVASETVALDHVGAQFERDIDPGTYEVITRSGIERHPWSQQDPAKCSFEFIYFSGADSIFDGTVVNTARIHMGEQLAVEHPVIADIVTAVPDSGRSAGHGYANESGIRYVEAIMRNRTADRTFIEPTQDKRQSALKLKFNMIPDTVVGQRVVLIDDSIVRGNTMKRLVENFYAEGAQEVHLRISSPPNKYPCHLGMDTGDPKQLLANKMSIEEMKDYFGVDSLGFLSEKGLYRAIGKKVGGLCMGCMTGEYPVPAPNLPKEAELG